MWDAGTNALSNSIVCLSGPALCVKFTSVSFQVVIELGYTESMNQKELRSVCSQCANAYSTMRRSPAPCALHLTSCEGLLAEGLLAAGLGNWTGVYRHTEAVPQAFSTVDGPIVMLSPDAEEPLLELDPAAVYVIGGIVVRADTCHECT